MLKQYSNQAFSILFENVLTKFVHRFLAGHGHALNVTRLRRLDVRMTQDCLYGLILHVDRHRQVEVLAS